jgi:hypothetical protein
MVESPANVLFAAHPKYQKIRGKNVKKKKCKLLFQIKQEHTDRD